MLILIAVAAFVSTLLGGLFALRLGDRLHLILGFSAGAVIAVAFFDLIPESLTLGGGAPSTLTAYMALGFVVYLVVDRLLLSHPHDNTHAHGRGILGAGSLSLHSLLDGVAVGFAFQVSSAVGLIVALAVLAHDFSDGINTVNMIVKNGGNRTSAMRWLIVDALAPVVGIVATMFIAVSQGALGILLALFAGFFLYIGASDLIPESHHAHPTFLTTAMTVLGVGVLFVVIKLAGV